MSLQTIGEKGLSLTQKEPQKKKGTCYVCKKRAFIFCVKEYPTMPKKCQKCWKKINEKEGVASL